MRPFILADNQYITRSGVLLLLEQFAFTDVIIEVSSSMELGKQLSFYPSAVVVLDYTLFDFSETQMMNMKQKYRDSLWILFSDELSKYFLRQALFSGQQFSVMMKTDSKEEIITALNHASHNEIYHCNIAAQILKEGVPLRTVAGKLTASERLILHEVALGKTTKEIAFEQCLSFHTIQTHRKNIFRKLEVNNVHDAIRYAVRAGIIELSEYYI